MQSLVPFWTKEGSERVRKQALSLPLTGSTGSYTKNRGESSVALELLLEIPPAWDILLLLTNSVYCPSTVVVAAAAVGWGVVMSL